MNRSIKSSPCIGMHCSARFMNDVAVVDRNSENRRIKDLPPFPSLSQPFRRSKDNAHSRAGLLSSFSRFARFFIWVLYLFLFVFLINEIFSSLSGSLRTVLEKKKDVEPGKETRVFKYFSSFPPDRSEIINPTK